MNVSQEEYTRSFHTYIRRMREKDYSSSYEKKYFLTFTHSGDSLDSRHSTKRLEFKTRIGRRAKVERATVRLLVEGDNCSRLDFYQRDESGSRHHLETLRPTRELLPQWRGVEAREDMIEERVLLDVEADPGCRLSSPALHLVLRRVEARSRRSLSHKKHRTDCESNPYLATTKRQRCCRHKMEVVFKELPDYDFIIQPYRFDAGYCKGSCPFRYNPANHHASLQSLMWRQKKGAAPKPCCAPSKLEQLEIIHLDDDDNTKLKVTTWSNMKVIECACF